MQPADDPGELPALGVAASTRRRAPTPARRPQKIPTPPKVGVGRSCQRSPVGTATRRSPRVDAEERAEDEVAAGRAAIVTAAAHADRVVPDLRMPFRDAPSALSVNRRRRAYNPPDVRLRRPVPLPRVVREPLPARPPREVQGLRARPRLDARAAVDADARLPRRFLGLVEGVRRPTSTTTGSSSSVACRRGSSSRARCSRPRAACSRTRA